MCVKHPCFRIWSFFRIIHIWIVLHCSPPKDQWQWFCWYSASGNCHVTKSLYFSVKIVSVLQISRQHVSHHKLCTGIIHVNVVTSISPKIHLLLFIKYMSLDRHEYKLQLHRSVEAYNHTSCSHFSRLSNRGKKSTICFSIFYDEVITPHHKI